jgi:hypothetical protein
MCEFVSWIETKDKKKTTVWFLTGKQVFHSKRGKELQDYTKSTADLVGHGAIRWFYGLKESQGINKECSDFSTPNNFPLDISKAIKDGSMRDMDAPLQLLTPKAWAEYQKIKQSALAEYQKIEQPAWAEYQKIEQPALAEYQKIEQSALAEYQKIKQSAFWDLFSVAKNRVKVWR